MGEDGFSIGSQNRAIQSTPSSWMKIRSMLPRKWTGGLYLVRSKPSPESFFSAPNGAEVYGSSFNLSWFDELGVSPHVIVDVGSYDGGDCLRFKAAFPEAQIITIEADPFRAELVRANLASTDIEVLETAILDREGPVDWFPALINGKPEASGSIFLMTEREAAKRSHIEQPSQPGTVSGTRLSTIIRQRDVKHIDLLHMDIQGAEYAALLGLEQHRPSIIYIEVGAAYKGAPPPSKVHALLRDMGYTLAADLGTDRLYCLVAK